MRLLRRGEQALLGGDVLARALQQLAGCGFALADERRDLIVGEIEDVVEQQHGALGGCQALQDDEERHRDLLERLEAAHPSFVEIDRLGQRSPRLSSWRVFAESSSLRQSRVTTVTR